MLGKVQQKYFTVPPEKMKSTDLPMIRKEQTFSSSLSSTQPLWTCRLPSRNLVKVKNIHNDNDDDGGNADEEDHDDMEEYDDWHGDADEEKDADEHGDADTDEYDDWYHGMEGHVDWWEGVWWLI